MSNFWDVLGITATKDKKKIRKAYSNLIKLYHPEDNPIEYKKIRDAYELAISYCNSDINEIEVDNKTLSNKQSSYAEQLILNNDLEQESKRRLQSVDATEEHDFSNISKEYFALVKDPNNLYNWLVFFENNENSNDILEMLHGVKYDRIDNENIILYILNELKKIDVLDEQNHKNNLEFKLKERLDTINYSIKGYPFFRIFKLLSNAIMISCILSNIIYFLLNIPSAILKSSDVSFDIIYKMFLVLVCSFQIYIIVKRNTNYRENYFYRDPTMIMITIYAIVVSIVSISQLVLYVILKLSNEDLYQIYFVSLLILLFIMNRRRVRKIYTVQPIELQKLDIIIKYILKYFIFMILIYLLLGMIHRDFAYLNKILYVSMIIISAKSILNMSKVTNKKSVYIIQIVIYSAMFFNVLLGINLSLKFLQNIDIFNSKAESSILAQVFMLSLLIIIGCYLARLENGDYIIKGRDK